MYKIEDIGQDIGQVSDKAIEGYLKLLVSTTMRLFKDIGFDAMEGYCLRNGDFIKTHKKSVPVVETDLRELALEGLLI